MDAALKKRAIHRGKILEGQIKSLLRAIENEDYCMDIITQSLAIQKSLGSLNKLIIENHISTHISHMISSGNPEKRELAITELAKIYELNNNRGTN
jgi:DNA-binding FrmR family transcriptional regulator